MSSSSNQQPPVGPSGGAAGPKFPVVIHAADRGTQILVIDASFVKLASGVGRIEVMLPPGLYKARFKAGDRIRDDLFEVSGQRLRIEGRALQFSSPVPLEHGISNSHEYQAGPARDLALGAPRIAFGDHGGELVLFVRDSAHQYGTPLPAYKPWAGVRLRRADQSVLFDLEGSGNVDVLAAYAGAKIALSPGMYFLSQPDGLHASARGRVFEVPIAVCKGWCTHVYMDSVDVCPIGPRDEVDTKRVRRADLAGAAMAMVRVQHGGGAALDPDVARLTELARQGLTNGEQAVSDDDLHAMVTGKFDYPMLGLYAMHLLLGRTPVNWSLIATIAGNVDRMLGGGHPDIQVFVDVCISQGLTVHSAQTGPPARLWPPVLATTWDLAEFAAAGFQGAWPGSPALVVNRTLRAGSPANSPQRSSAPQPSGSSPALPSKGTKRRRRYRVPARTEDERLRQFRVSGSIWSCLLVPEATLSAWSRRKARRAQQEGVENRGAAPELNAPTSESAALLLEAEPPATENRLSTPRPPKVAVERGPSLEEWKDLADGLRRVNPNHTPFQQALRRRVLDLVPRDPATGVDLEADQEFDFDRLAEQFRLPRSRALKAYAALRREAKETVIAESRARASEQRGQLGKSST